MCNLIFRRLFAIGGLPALLLSLFIPWGAATAGKPIIDPSYADGELVYMIGPHVIPNPNPQLYAQSEELCFDRVSDQSERHGYRSGNASRRDTSRYAIRATTSAQMIRVPITTTY